MRKVTAMIAGLIFIAALWSACLVAVVDYSGSGEGVVDDFFSEAPLFSGGTVSLSNFDGDIEIVGWDEERVEITARKLGGRTSRTTFRFMSWKPPQPRIDVEESDDSVKISTLASEQGGEDVIVDYFLSVPHAVSLKDILARDGSVHLADLYGDAVVELRSGEITVENYSGSLNASLLEGSIRAALYDIRETDRVRLSVREGDIHLELPADVAARIEGFSPEGEIESDFDFEESPRDGRFSEQVGEGGGSISLTAMNGNIIITRRLEDPGD